MRGPQADDCEVARGGSTPIALFNPYGRCRRRHPGVAGGHRPVHVRAGSRPQAHLPAVPGGAALRGLLARPVLPSRDDVPPWCGLRRLAAGDRRRSRLAAGQPGPCV